MRHQLRHLESVVIQILQENPGLVGNIKLTSKAVVLSTARSLLGNLQSRLESAAQARRELQVQFDALAPLARCDECPTAAYARQHYLRTLYTITESVELNFSEEDLAVVHHSINPRSP
jgi:hypothetical protein